VPRPPRGLPLGFLAVLACVAVLAAAVPAAGAAPTRMEKRLVAKINDTRAAHGLRRLRIGSRLAQSAHRWSLYLLRADSFFHARLAAGTCENLAWGTCGYMSPAAAVRMWLSSSSHRANLLDRDNRYVGTGWTVGRWQGYGCVKMVVARFR
jgi:uncharacterized protein YkwD